jgi:hypothetical protein
VYSPTVRAAPHATVFTSTDPKSPEIFAADYIFKKLTHIMP